MIRRDTDVATLSTSDSGASVSLPSLPYNRAEQVGGHDRRVTVPYA